MGTARDELALRRVQWYRLDSNHREKEKRATGRKAR
jgi:hypothetical protein